MTDDTATTILGFALGLGCALWAWQGVYYGQISVRFTDYSRRDQPKTFWSIVGFFSILALFFACDGLASLLGHPL
jgi:hypothetical protein